VAAQALTNAFPKQANSRIDNITAQNSSPVKIGHQAGGGSSRAVDLVAFPQTASNFKSSVSIAQRPSTNQPLTIKPHFYSRGQAAQPIEITFDGNEESLLDVPETRTLRAYTRPKALNPLNGLSNFHSNETAYGGKLRTKQPSIDAGNESSIPLLKERKVRSPQLLDPGDSQDPWAKRDSQGSTKEVQFKHKLVVSKN